jgi:hypothetical protein
MPHSKRRAMPVLLTPDSRYIIVRGRLWRAANPAMDPVERDALTRRLMNARREVAAARRVGDDERLARARGEVDAAKVALGERGAVWWTDGAPDLNRKLVKNTPYAPWFERAGAPAHVR